MIPIILFLLVTTASIDLMTDEGELLDGFVYVEDRTITLQSWETTNNPNRYIGTTEAGDSFYMLVMPDKILLKIWEENGTLRIIESQT